MVISTSTFTPTRYHGPPCTGTVMKFEYPAGEAEWRCTLCEKPPHGQQPVLATTPPVPDDTWTRRTKRVPSGGGHPNAKPLTPTERMYLEAYSEEGVSQAAVARKFGVSVNSVRKSLESAKEKPDYQRYLEGRTA